MGKYKNPDKRCKYPYVENDLLDYCWSYALVANKKMSKHELKQECKHCDYFKPSPR